MRPNAYVPLPDKQVILDRMHDRYVAFYGMFTELKHRRGSDWRGKCPIHGGDNDQAFAVDASTGLHLCRTGCGGEGGDPIGFLQRVRNCSFIEALTELAEFVGITDDTTTITGQYRQETTPVQINPKPVSHIPESVADELHAALLNCQQMVDWLQRNRGISRATIVALKLGMQSPRDKGGYCRITFPQRDETGAVENIACHLFGYLPALTDEVRKEHNKTMPIRAGLPTGLFPLRAVDGVDSVVVCGGQPDAALAFDLGIPAVTGTAGEGTFKAEWAEQLSRLGVKRATVLYDNDAAGRAGAQRAAGVMAKQGITVRVAKYPDQVNDLTEWVKREGASKADVERVLSEAQPFAPNSAEPAQPLPAEWETPIPLVTVDRSLPKFPVEALPPIMADLTNAAAESIQISIDLPAWFAVGVVALAAMPRYEVAVGEGFVETTNIYANVYLPSGERKSPAVKIVLAPVREIQTERAEADRPLVAEAAQMRKVMQRKLEALEKVVANPKTGADVRVAAESEMRAITRDLLAPLPVVTQLLVDDVTVEKQAAIMAEQGGFIGHFSDEAGLLGQAAGRYSKTSNFEIWLHAHVGTPIRVDRKSSPPLEIPHPLETIVVAAQPGVLHAIAAHPEFRERGLIARFWQSLPAPSAGTRKFRNKAISQTVTARWRQLVRALFDTPAPQSGTSCYRLRIEGEALEIWTEWHDAIETRIGVGRDLSGIADWTNKLPGQIARLAGILHVAEHYDNRPWEHPISAETVAAACAIGEYGIPHALACFGEMRSSDPRRNLARQIIDWLKSRSGGEFSQSDCYMAHRSQSSHDTENVAAALALLVKHNYVRNKPTERAQRGQSPSPRFIVNPLLKAAENAENAED